ncbi:MAG TPA: hypothetical protein VMM16_03095 [Verrucomicrobiae bacterium]|nr:hypothetical protein [Verrucomicrobiae bacterium]
MTDQNPGRERQRLAELYAGMADGELEKLAGEAATLSDVAREALRLETSRRGLAVVLQESMRVDAPPPGPVTLRRFRDLPDALLAKSILDSAAIECFLADENTIRMNWLWSDLLGGVKLWVRPGDVDAAELLDQDYVEVFIVDGVGEYKQPRCPNCQSFAVSYRGLIKQLAYASILGTWLTGIVPPLRIHRRGWDCHACGHAWGDINEPPGETP